MTRSSDLINLLEQRMELRETLTFTSLLKDMINDPDEKSDEEVLSAGASVPVEMGVHHPLSMWMCSPTQKLSELPTIAILWRFPHIGVVHSYLHF